MMRLKACVKYSWIMVASLIVVLMGVMWPPPTDALQDRILIEMTVAEARDLVSEQKGRPVVVMIYRTSCPRSRRAFSQLVDLAGQWKNRDLAVLVFSSDKNNQTLKEFLDRHDPPFNRYRLTRWKKGDLDQAMGEVGIRIGETFKLPLLAVLDSEGTVVLRQEGVGSLGQVEKAVKELL